MADDGKATTAAAAGDSGPDAVPPTEPTSKSPELSRPEQDTEASGKEGDRESGEAGTTSEEPKKSQSPPADAAKDEKPTDSSEPAEPEPSADKAEGEEGDETPAVSTPAAKTGANGAAASAKKSANGKRKSSGIPEHRSKKLNRKKSAARITHLDAQPGEYYIARLKSYSPWPAIICDEEMLPQSLLATRPVTTMQPDGTYKEAYRDGGKRAHERTFPIMFLQTNEFAWIPNTDLTPLDPASCVDISEKGKSKTLLAAYEIASEGHDLQHFKDMLADHQRALQEDIDEQEAKATAKAAKQDKKKRKSMDVAEPDDEEADDPKEKRKSAKKRKKEVESEGESEKPAKTPKTATKLKLTTPKTPTTGETAKKPASTSRAAKSKAASAKKSGKKAASDEDTGVETPKEPEKAADKQDAKAKREKEILYLRYKLQKGFLTRDQAPEEEEMDAMHNYISKLESYSDLEVSVIRSTKINKVLKAIIKLSSIPKEEEYDFRGRSVKILSKWKQLLDSDLPSAAGASKSEAKPTANGVQKEKESEAKPEETAEGDEKDSAAATETPKETPAKDADVAMPDADEVEKADDSPEKTKEAGTPEKETEGVAA